ncbi:hypothetical protein BV898_02486 [Hypsibius exemplaris]|uniref:Uncharacterized protein n=1 Tax=Hypsibius exemplaris TaxID=2072580 RepID=A0A1W0X8C6_HYPEX|nr:hypothetical protein BV898_02486 [Hypsibius exemplaris]
MASSKRIVITLGVGLLIFFSGVSGQAINPMMYGMGQYMNPYYTGFYGGFGNMGHMNPLGYQISSGMSIPGMGQQQQQQGGGYGGGGYGGRGLYGTGSLSTAPNLLLLLIGTILALKLPPYKMGTPALVLLARVSFLLGLIQNGSGQLQGNSMGQYAALPWSLAWLNPSYTGFYGGLGNVGQLNSDSSYLAGSGGQVGGGSSGAYGYNYATDCCSVASI